MRAAVALVCGGRVSTVGLCPVFAATIFPPSKCDVFWVRLKNHRIQPFLLVSVCVRVCAMITFRFYFIFRIVVVAEAVAVVDLRSGLLNFTCMSRQSLV